MSESMALVMVGNIPHRAFHSREDAHDYVRKLPENRKDAVSVMWPVRVGGPNE